MHLRLILLRVESTIIRPPSTCPYESRGGKHFALHQQVDKAVRDTVYDGTVAHRYECLHCQRAFRVYPQGVTRVHSSL